MSQGSSVVNLLDSEEVFSDSLKTEEEKQLEQELRQRVRQELEDKQIADLVADLAENGPFTETRHLAKNSNSALPVRAGETERGVGLDTVRHPQREQRSVFESRGLLEMG